MSDLLDFVLDSHGGLRRWSEVGTLTARTTVGGPFWVAKGWPDTTLELTIGIDTRRQYAEITPFTAPDRVLVLDIDADRDEPERVSVLTATGATLEHRTDPRSSFQGLAVTSPWHDPLRIGYFLGYAMWNYLTSPFLLTWPGVTTEEIEPWRDGDETWRRLHVTFPPTIATHHGEQVFYYDVTGLQRRMDYLVDVNGGADIAHYTDNPVTVDGLVIPSRRRVYRRLPDNTADRSTAAITIDIHDVDLG
jgi:hypothetical protein